VSTSFPWQEGQDILPKGGLEISLPRQREIVITLRAFHIFSVQLKNKAQGNGPLKMGTGLLPVPLIDLLTHESNLAKHPV